jgi:gas vesicle structural protein
VRDHRVGLAEREVSLVEILDRALGSGVVITGDLTISLADVDLVYLNLRVLVASVGTILEGGSDRTGDEVVPVGSR